MKLFFILFVLIGVMLAAYPFFDASNKNKKLIDLPWQIEITEAGSTRVFGLHLGHSTLAEAVTHLGSDMSLAIVAANDEAGSLEMYYGHFRSGLLSGKLVITADVDTQSVKAWRNNAVRQEYMATGKAKKYFLSEKDLPRAMDTVISGLTFIPNVNLDEALVVARFGKPDQRLADEAETHLLYPEKGLQVSLYEHAKEVLQYVPPADFSVLRQSLVNEFDDMSAK